MPATIDKILETLAWRALEIAPLIGIPLCAVLIAFLMRGVRELPRLKSPPAILVFASLPAAIFAVLFFMSSMVKFGPSQAGRHVLGILIFYAPLGVLVFVFFLSTLSLLIVPKSLVFATVSRRRMISAVALMAALYLWVPLSLQKKSPDSCIEAWLMCGEMQTDEYQNFRSELT